MGNFFKKLFWDSEEKIAPAPPPVFLLEDLTPNRSIWSFYKKKEEKKEFEYDVPYPKFG